MAGTAQFVVGWHGYLVLGVALHASNHDQSHQQETLSGQFVFAIGCLATYFAQFEFSSGQVDRQGFVISLHCLVDVFLGSVGEVGEVVAGVDDSNILLQQLATNARILLQFDLPNRRNGRSHGQRDQFYLFHPKLQNVIFHLEDQANCCFLQRSQYCERLFDFLDWRGLGRDRGGAVLRSGLFLVEEVGESSDRDVVGVEGESSVVERGEVTLLRFFAARTPIQYLFLNLFPRVSVLRSFPLTLIPHSALSVASLSPYFWFFLYCFLNARELFSFETNRVLLFVGFICVFIFFITRLYVPIALLFAMLLFSPRRRVLPLSSWLPRFLVHFYLIVLLFLELLILLSIDGSQLALRHLFRFFLVCIVVSLTICLFLCL